jgi:hypothetical protein
MLFPLAVLLSLHGRAAEDAPAPGNSFAFRDSPKPVVFYGDDATEQRMFSTLIETYTLSRFPAWKIRFRNTGWAGDKLLGTGLRASSRDQDIRRDIESFGPQFVLVNYGMNDARAGDAGLSYFLTCVNILSRDLPRVGVNRAAFTSSNPVEGYAAGAPAGSNDNLMLQKYADGMKERVPLGWKDGVAAVTAHPKGPDLPLVADGIFIDVLNPMISLIEAGRKAGVLSADDSQGDKTARLVPDGVHPNWAGHFVMATLMLQGLHAPDLVSSAVLDAAGRTTTSAENCVITWQDSPAGTIRFQRTDNALPWPTPPDVDLALKLPGFDPATTLNRYELKITGLKAASYQLTIDGAEIGTYAQSDLANGINLGFLRAGPIYDQGQKLLKAVVDKNDTFFHRWREVQLGPPPPPGTNAADLQKLDAAHQTEVKPELDRLDKQIADDEAAIHQLSQPVPHTFQLEPVTR